MSILSGKSIIGGVQLPYVPGNLRVMWRDDSDYKELQTGERVVVGKKRLRAGIRVEFDALDADTVHALGEALQTPVFDVQPRTRLHGEQEWIPEYTLRCWCRTDVDAAVNAWTRTGRFRIDLEGIDIFDRRPDTIDYELYISGIDIEHELYMT